MNAASDGTGDWLLRAFKQNPEGLLLLAAGAALFLRQGARSPSRATRHSSPSGGDYVPQSQPRSMAGQMQEAAAPYAAAATGYAREAGDSIRRQSEKLTSQVYETADYAVERVVDQQPLVIALAGLAVGAVVAAAFPPTGIERSAMGPIGARVSETAQRVAHQAKEAAGAAGETLKAAAEQRGLNVEGLKEVASNVATSFTDTMRGDGNTNSSPKMAEEHL